MIKFTCTCGNPLRVKDKYAGKRVRCPACGQTIEVPTNPVSRAPSGHWPGAAGPSPRPNA